MAKKTIVKTPSTILSDFVDDPDLLAVSKTHGGWYIDFAAADSFFSTVNSPVKDHITNMIDIVLSLSKGEPSVGDCIAIATLQKLGILKNS